MVTFQQCMPRDAQCEWQLTEWAGGVVIRSFHDPLIIERARALRPEVSDPAFVEILVSQVGIGSLLINEAMLEPMRELIRLSISVLLRLRFHVFCHVFLVPCRRRMRIWQYAMLREIWLVRVLSSDYCHVIEEGCIAQGFHFGECWCCCQLRYRQSLPIVLLIKLVPFGAALQELTLGILHCCRGESEHFEL